MFLAKRVGVSDAIELLASTERAKIELLILARSVGVEEVLEFKTNGSSPTV